MAKVATDDLYPIHRTLTESQPAPIIDNPGAGTVTYYGHAPLGSQRDKPEWKIVRVTIAGNVTTTEYADGDMRYDNVWDDRASLSYSR